MDTSNNLCLYQLADGTVECRACDDPPENSSPIGLAPVGLEAGIYPSNDLRIKGDDRPPIEEVPVA